MLINSTILLSSYNNYKKTQAENPQFLEPSLGSEARLGKRIPGTLLVVIFDVVGLICLLPFE